MGKGIEKRQKRILLSVRKITLLTALLIALGMFGHSQSAFASDDRFALIKTVYHVYVDGEDIGIIHNQKIVEQMKSEIVKDAENRFKDVHLTVNEDIKYVPERIFRPEIDQEKIRQKLKDKLTIGVQAYKVTVDGDTLGYFKNKEEAEKVLDELKLEYVDEQTLNQLKKQKEQAAQQAEKADKPEKKEKPEALKEQVLDVTFSEPVNIIPAKATPKELMSVKDAVKLFKKGTLEEKKHKIKDGETLEEIAKKYDLTIDELYKLNPKLKKDDIIKPGETLVVTAYEPFATVIVKEQVKKLETIDYKVEVKEDDSMPKGESKIKQDGKEGKREVFYSLTKVNGKVKDKEVLSEEVLSKPVTEIKLKGTKVIPSRGTGSFHWPAVGGYISSKMGMRWGSMHKGIDIARPSNKNILAADNGTVVSAGWNDGGYGNRIIIDHHNGLRTTYNHMSSLSVSTGQTVKRGQKIGVMGATGNVTGVHLHFEVYKNGSLVNPLNYIHQ